ncbi:BDNF/NT-3 growth factors receptor-like [Bacillus rossius redtenbacheri]|uniref:BDNF/NT-3 growth factors receptor-like n=1 Tax=Bacillus rossius redtenbacheri TaxID=93214 RepID=UPI002FDD4670
MARMPLSPQRHEVSRRDGNRSGSPCRPGVCGEDAACKVLPGNAHTCVCPHDGSPPTQDLRCPRRNTVPVNPMQIRNINMPSGANVTTNGTSTANLTAIMPKVTEQAERAVRAHAQTSPEVIATVAVPCLLLAVSLAACLWKWKAVRRCAGRPAKSRDQSCNGSPASLSKGLLVAGRYTANPQYSVCESRDSVPVPVIPHDSVAFLQEIGEGCFGKVYKGELRRKDRGEPEVVAVKMLKESATREAEEDFMREVDIMSTFRHTNILSLIGVVLRSSSHSPWMVFEFMPHGDLAGVLRSNSKQFWKPVSGLLPLDKNLLLSIAQQIAAGMCYLASQRFVHRDLACRNCLVGSGYIVKIADFGMSRDVYTCDYYKIGGSRLLPIRWMAPESIMYGRFTLESDVWSFGIVLWEIYSFGKQPYYGHTNEEAIKLILQGIMLIPPDDCPAVVCELMRSCWKTEPRDRVRFLEIHDQLEKARPPGGGAPSPRLPRPPEAFPVGQLRAAELVDADDYLRPRVPPASQTEYLQPLPD